MAKLGKVTKEDKRPIRVGIVLMLCAFVLVIFIVKIDAVLVGLSAVANALRPIIYGIGLAYLLNVFVRFFEGVVFKPINKRVTSKAWQKAKRPISIVLSVILVLALVVLFMLFVIPDMLKSLKNLAIIAQKNIPQYLNSLIVWLDDFAKENNLNVSVNSLLGNFDWNSIISSATTLTTGFLTALFDTTVGLVSFVTTAFVTFIFSLFFLAGKDSLIYGMRAGIYAFLPTRTAEKISEVSKMANGIFYSFIKGKLLDSAIVGAICYVGMLIFKFEYALLISVVVGIMNIIPIVGAFLGGAFGVFVLLISNPIQSLWFLLFILVLQQLDGNIIFPKIVGTSMGLPSVWTMFAVFVFGSLWGIPGILIGTPSMAVIYELLRHSVNKNLDKKGIEGKELKTKSIALAVADGVEDLEIEEAILEEKQVTEVDTGTAEESEKEEK